MDHLQSRALIIIDNGFARQVLLDHSNRTVWTIGRQNSEAPPDIPIASLFVSKEQGKLFLKNGKWIYENTESSLCGTWYNTEPLGRADRNGDNRPRELKDGDILQVRSQAGKVLLLFQSGGVEGSWTSCIMDKIGDRIFAGSNPDYCSLCLALPNISARNTAFSLGGDHEWYVEDLGSVRGTVLNGELLHEKKRLQEGDRIQIDKCLMIYTENRLYYNEAGRENRSRTDYMLRSRKVILSAEIDSKVVKDKRSSSFPAAVRNLFIPAKKELLRDVRLEIREGTLVALLGTAGAGKSTVMNCLNGMELQGVRGRIFFDGVDLQKHFGKVQSRIGSVPQQKVVHPSLTVTEELTEAAVLRLPAGTSRKEIRRRVSNTIRVLGLEKVKDSRIVKLSGGEMGRVNVGIELVADRKLLCLDEPDAGLSPNLKKELFILLQNLAHRNNVTILAIIHDVSEIYMFDQIIMMVKAENVGRLAFSGTPDETRKYFGTEIKNIYEILESNPEKYVRESGGRHL